MGAAFSPALPGSRVRQVFLRSAHARTAATIRPRTAAIDASVRVHCGNSMAAPRRTDSIDAVRGIAILAVITVHTAYKLPPPWQWLRNFMQSGQYGVQLFFLASAITLYNSLATRASEPRATLRFLIRRFFRIAPLYYPATLFYFAYMNGMGAKISPVVPVANLLFVHALFPSTINVEPPGGWSVGIEMLFYLLLPLVFRTVKRLGTAVWFLVACLGLAIGANWVSSRSEFHGRLPELYLQYYLPNQLYVFAMGICAYFVVKDRLGPGDVRAVGSAWKIAMFASMIAIVLLGSFRKPGLLCDVLIALAMAGFVASLAQWRPRWIVNRAICFIGKRSFGIYLIHFVVLHLCFGVFTSLDVGTGLGQTLALIAMVAAGSTFLAGATKRWIEDWGIRFGNRLIERTLGQQVRPFALFD